MRKVPRKLLPEASRALDVKDLGFAVKTGGEKAAVDDIKLHPLSETRCDGLKRKSVPEVLELEDSEEVRLKRHRTASVSSPSEECYAKGGKSDIPTNERVPSVCPLCQTEFPSR